MILGFPRAKQGLCHTKHWGSGGYHFVSIAHRISSFKYLHYYCNFLLHLIRRDHDGIQDNYDNCEFTPNADQLDTDDDNIGKQLMYMCTVY